MTQSSPQLKPEQLRDGAAWLAGEASGDFLASLVIPHLTDVMGGAAQYGIGGEKMVEAGLTPWYSLDRLAVRGYVEVIKKLPGLLSLRRQMIRRVTEADPRVFIGVDAPDFNLDIEIKLKAKGIPTVHFVSPAVWAWRPERIYKIAKAVDHMLLVFPFEERIYRQAQIPATYIGHPLAEIIPFKPATYEARRALGIDTHGEPLFAVLPGSRVDEVTGCTPIFFAACERVLERLGGAGYFVLPAIDEARREQILKVADRYPKLAERLTVVTGQSHRVLESSDAVLVASGTATLEAALFKKPMVVGYTMPAFSAMIMRKKGLIPYVSLPNILAGRRIVPEFLHYFCQPDAIAASLVDQLKDKRRSELVEIFEAMHVALSRPTGALAAEAISRVMR